jgi:choline dehydrogenase-like flavoprotein
MRFAPEELQDLGEALRRLCECLFAAGAVVIYPAISGCPVLTCEADVALLPATIPANRANLSTLHLFSSCRMGEKRHGCTADSFGKVYGADRLYIVDASLLCGPTTVNPQGTVMAIAHRNIVEFLSL